LPLSDGSVDCLVSNCVINLAPDKRSVFREMMRVLRPGGRVAVSDIALKKQLPTELKQSVEAYVGCISGALLMSDYEEGLRGAGFEAVQVIDAGKDLNAYALLGDQAGCCSPAMASSPGLPVVDACCGPSLSGSTAVHDGLADLLRRYDVNEYAASVYVYALKAPA
jgi:hypothetical protein